MTPSSAESFRDSVWAATAREPAPPATPLATGRHVDLAIVGGGITGCSAALAAAESGASAAILEARHVGWGASGRNGGQVIPGLKLDPSEMRAKYGEAAGTALAQAVGGNADIVFDLIGRHGIDCGPKRGGWIQAAPGEAALARVQARARDWAAFGAPVELLDADAVFRLTGTRTYVGGWIDRRAGTLNPLSYVRGLARAATAAGASLHEACPVTAMAREAGAWRVETPTGPIVAKHVLVGTDGYTGPLVAGLERTILAVQSAQIATEPLSPALQARIMPDGVCASETRRLAFYFRLSPDGRLVFGGRGAVGDRQNPAFSTALVAAMRRTFPEVAAVPVAYRWSGQVALTLDGLPHLHEPEPGLLVGLGYNGRGVAMATLMGRWLAARALRGEAPPLPASALSPIPWHGIRRPAIALGIGWAWLRDRVGMAA